MKPQTLVVIEYMNSRLASLQPIAEAASSFGVNMIALVRPTLDRNDLADLPFQAMPVEDWSTAGLEAAVQAIEEHQCVVGIGSYLGFFTPHGLLAAQVAELCERRKLPHCPVEALYNTNNKYLMRQRLSEGNVYTVRSARVTDAETLLSASKHVGFPLILKPVIGLGSSFISRCNDLEEMQRVYAHYQKEVKNGYYSRHFFAHEVNGEHFEPLQEMLAEQAIDGLEVSVECLCTDNQILPLVIHDKLDVEQTAYCAYENLLITPPVRLSANQQQQVLTYTRVVLNTLGLKNCFCHVELRYDSKGRASIIEVNPRIGGMRIKDSLHTLRGVHFPTVYVQQLLGKPVNLPDHPKPEGYFAMSAVFPRQSGVLSEIRGIKMARLLPGVLSVTPHVAPGSYVGGDYEEVFAVDAWFHAQTPTAIQLLDRQLKNLIVVDVES